MSLLLHSNAPIRPFTASFVGSISADGQTTRVAALALTAQGRVALLNLVANDTTVSAATARLFKGEPLAFQLAEGLRWDGASQLGRVEGVSYRQIKAAVPNTREKNVLIIPHTADIGEGLSRPDAIETPSPTRSATTPTPDRPPRFVFANHDAAAPSARAFLGHLRALRVVFLPHWADALWQDGLAADLITPLPALGVSAWQLASDQARWHELVSEAVRTRRMTGHAAVITA
jgi:hypothetical protein